VSVSHKTRVCLCCHILFSSLLPYWRHLLDLDQITLGATCGAGTICPSESHMFIHSECHIRNWNFLPFASTWEFTLDFLLVGSGLLIFLWVFLCWPSMDLYVLSFVLWCPLRFPHNLKRCSVRLCRQLFVFFTFVCVCLFADSSLQHILCCIWCFVCLRLVCLLLPVSLDCPFLIAPSVFSNVYLPVSLECPFLIVSSVFSNVYLPVSLECSFLIASSVFSNVYLPVSLECSFLIASSVFSNVYLPVSLECPFLIVPSVFSNVYLIRFVLLIFSFLGLFTLHYCASLFLIIFGHQFVFLYWLIIFYHILVWVSDLIVKPQLKELAK
jgi:hypothetical protein